MAVDPFEVIHSRFNGSAELQAAIPGGLHPGRARTDTTQPYASVNIVSQVPGWTTEDGYTELFRIQFSLFASTSKGTREAAKVFTRDPVAGFDHLLDVPLDNGAVVLAQRVGGTTFLDESEGPDAERAWVVTLDYMFHFYWSS